MATRQGGGLLLFLMSALGRDTAGRKQGKNVSRGTFCIVSRGTFRIVSRGTLSYITNCST